MSSILQKVLVGALTFLATSALIVLGSAVTDGRVVEGMGGVARSEFERRLRLEEDGAGHVLSGTHRTDHGATAARPLRPGTNAPYIQLLACWRAVTE